MVEAKHNVQQAELRANMSIAVRVLAQRESMELSKDQL